MKTITIYTDGACKGNPGPGGWGAVLQFQGKQKELFGGAPDVTNNQMELTAAVEALNALTEPCRVELYTDSQYVRQGITSWIHGWKKKGWKNSAGKPVKNQELWMALEAATGRHDVQWHWVKGHSGHPLNDLADALANKGVVHSYAPNRS
ncbi:ribonuclease HI [Allohahella sp. A8]|uniref:ribonuclease HI n=1 Tax=Allohahella sp. A8 TaxID=3141461 RepID=UPI000C09FE6C|nr:ribonuclease HI [Hahellaceae bacterium]